MWGSVDGVACGTNEEPRDGSRLLQGKFCDVDSHKSFLEVLWVRASDLEFQPGGHVKALYLGHEAKHISCSQSSFVPS